MKAIVQTRYGSADALELLEIDNPTVEPDEVLVRVHAASIHPDVWHVVHGRPYAVRVMGAGLLKPKNRVPGTDLAGTVEAVGEDAERFHPGEAVFGESVRGHQWHNGGAFAEFASVREKSLAPKPASVSFEQAAAVPTSALIALQGVRDEGKVQPGSRVLVNGAGGGVGGFAVQIAKVSGADVTGVDGTAKLDMMRSIGADRVIDYTNEDFTRTGEHYDLIVDIPGNHSLSDCRRALTPTGTYVLIGHEGFGQSGGRWIGAAMGRFVKMLVMSPFVSQEMSPRVSEKTDDPLGVIGGLVESGQITVTVDRTYPLGQVAEALHYLERGTAVGKIVITI